MAANQARCTTIRITITAIFMAMNIALSSFGIPVPGGHLYLCDVIICLAAILLGPLEAFAVGGIGSFLGDLLFYPLPMFVSLVTHGLQAVVISLIAQGVIGAVLSMLLCWNFKIGNLFIRMIGTGN